MPHRRRRALSTVTAGASLALLLTGPAAAGVFCEVDSDCDDGVACTIDRCIKPAPLFPGQCANRIDGITCAANFQSSTGNTSCDRPNSSSVSCLFSVDRDAADLLRDYRSRFAFGLCAAGGVGTNRVIAGSAEHKVEFDVRTPGGYRLDVRQVWNGYMRAKPSDSALDGRADGDVSLVSGVWAGSGRIVPEASFGSLTFFPSIADPGEVHRDAVSSQDDGEAIDGAASAVIYDVSNGAPRSHALSFTWDGDVRGEQLAIGSVRLGMDITDPGFTGGPSCKYPGSPSRDIAADGHFVEINVVPLCGNGQIDAEVGEECDPTDSTDAACCTSDCTRCCGDGVATPGEPCDPSVPGAVCPVVCGALDFADDDWASTAMSLVNAASWADDPPAVFAPLHQRLRLTPATTGAQGAAWYNPAAINPARDWSTNFSFQLTYPSNGGADGLSLIIQRSGLAADLAAGVDGSLGTSPYLAIGVDTFLNDGIDAFGESLEVHVNGTFPGPVGSSTQGLNLGNSRFSGCAEDLKDCIYTLYARYEAATTSLIVTVTSPHHPGSVTGTWDLDLAALLGDSNNYRVGFAANTGASAENHDVLRWAFAFSNAGCGNGVVEPGEVCEPRGPGGQANPCCTAQCSFRPNGSSCNDGSFCNGADTCNGGTCSSHAGNPCPGPDGDGNCAESCSELFGNCTAPDPVGSACSDGLFCNGADACSTGGCSVHAGNPCPGADGDGNCAESCNEAGDACTLADPNGTPCTDGLFCNGADSCAAGVCSSHAGNPCPGADGDGNCAESCNEAGDACTLADPNGTPCTDGLFCNGADACAAGVCSFHAGNPCPGADGDGNCAESCNEAGDACTLADPDGTVCRTASGPCDVAETCRAGSCPSDGFAASGTPCRAAVGSCDVAEACSGTGGECPVDATRPAGSECRAAVGGCDLAEACDGVGGNCPADAWQPAGVVCRAATGACDSAEICEGNAAACPHDARRPAGSECRAAAGDCDVAEQCDGIGGECPADARQPATAVCRDAVDVCDVAETCDGSSSDCPADTLAPPTAVCRASTGICDVTEHCDGVAAGCPGDGFSADATSCDDGLFCTGTDTCRSGRCTSTGDPCQSGARCEETADMCMMGECPAAPASCAAAGKSLLMIRNDSAATDSNLLIWKWLRGAAADREDFGDPTGVAVYAFCLYGDGALLSALTVPPSDMRWRPLGEKGFVYGDASGSAFGVEKIVVKGTGEAGKSKAIVKAKGANLPYAGLDQPLTASTLIAQLHNTATGLCLEGAYPVAAANKHTATQFKGIAQ